MLILFVKKAAKAIGKIRKSTVYRAWIYYAFFYKYCSPKKGIILFESFSGANINGQPFYLLKEVYENPSAYEYRKIVVSASKNSMDKVRRFLQAQGFHTIDVVRVNSLKYCRYLAIAEVLVNNSTFPRYFIKKDEQFYLNTWHGTPLKKMGKSLPNPNESDNVQRNLFMADLVTVNSNYMEHIFQTDYLLSIKDDRHLLKTGNCANTAFFHDSDAIKQKLGLAGKTVIAFMPTWRGEINKRNYEIVDEYNDLYHDVTELLGPDFVFFIKTHQLVSNEEKELFQKFPVSIETYEFLNAVDILITDYSSVMFDYAHKKKTVILYMPDLEEYMNTRGLYIPDFVNQFPFEMVYSKTELIEKLRIITQEPSNAVRDYAEFLQTYCTYDSEVATGKLLDRIKEMGTGSEISYQSQNKKKILVYTGSLAYNGITTALIALLNRIDREKYDVYAFKYSNKKNNNLVNKFLAVTSNIHYFPINRKMLTTPFEGIMLFLSKGSKGIFKISQRIRKETYERMYKKSFQTQRFDYLIHYSGYEADVKQIFSENKYTKNSIKILYIHSDMFSEKKLKKNINFHYLEDSFKNFDRIALVNEHLRQELLNNYSFLEDKLYVCPNIFNISRYENTNNANAAGTDTDRRIDDVLSDRSIFKFITIGRYSPEKGHLRLINAFDKIHHDYPNTVLIIIGGHGKSYSQTVERIESSPYGSHIFHLRNIDNPQYYLSKSNGFVLSSFYEGIGIVLFEALYFRIPIISTNIPGPSGFLQKGYGEVVENSEEGLVIGMEHLVQHKVSQKEFDFNDFNEDAYDAFEEMLEGKK